MGEKRRARPIEGRTALDRVTSFFQFVTRSLCRRPGYGKSVLRAMASTEPEVVLDLTRRHSAWNSALRTPVWTDGHTQSVTMERKRASKQGRRQFPMPWTKVD